MLINTTYLSYFKILIIFSFFFPKFIYSSCDPDNALADYEHPESGWCYEQSTTQMFYNFQEAFITTDNTEIDLESSGVPYNTDYNNAVRNEKRTGKNWRPTTTCWNITYKSKACCN